MHLKRWLTAIIALPVLFYIIGFGPAWIFYAVVLAAGLIGLFEFYKTTCPSMPKPVLWLSGFISLLLFLAIYLKHFFVLPGIMTFWAIGPLTYFMLSQPSLNQAQSSHMSKAVLGPLYVILPLGLLVLIHMRPAGDLWIFFFLVVMFANDTGAYYFGRFLGKRSLYKSISPKKTWEGAIGGFFCSIIVGAAYIKMVFHESLDFKTIGLLLLLPVFGQLGDLAASMLKRMHDAKDFGNILPGHGGILDRIDGFIFAVPVLYVYLAFRL